MNQKTQSTLLVVAGMITCLALFGIAGTMDYEDQKAAECQGKGMLYDKKADKCRGRGR